SGLEGIADKRRRRRWCPTRYADGASSRGNAGVDTVSALVFDLDRVPPDPKRLEGVRWNGHTIGWPSTKPSRGTSLLSMAGSRQCADDADHADHTGDRSGGLSACAA